MSSKEFSGVDNLTKTLSADDPGYFIISVQTIILLVIILLSLFGNFLVVYLIINHKQLWTATNTTIASLSVSDLLRTVLCTCFAFPVVFIKDWSFEDNLCIANGFFNLFFSIASTQMVMIIAIDRLLVLSKTVPVNEMRVYVFLSIAASWFLSLLFGLPWYAVNMTKQSIYRKGFYHCMYVFSAIDSNEGPIYSLIIIIFLFVAPFAVMISSCLVMWAAFKRNLVEVRPVTMDTKLLHFRGEIYTATTLLIMITLHICCWGPYCIMALVSVFTRAPISSTMDRIAIMLAWAQAAVNPIIYAARNPNIIELMNLTRRSHKVPRSGSYHTHSQGTADTPVKRDSSLSWATVTPGYLFLMDADRKGSDLSTATSATTI